MLILLIAGTIRAQISPGDLTTSHSDLDGMSNCTKCHELGETHVKEKCLDCHNEIKSLMDQNRGYHSDNSVKIFECNECHSEHNGREFDMLHFNESLFDHSAAKYELVGKHARINCKKCHTPEYIADDELKKRQGSYLGLETKCLSCHSDYHKKQLSDECSNCHNTNVFKPAVGFNHGTTNYKLTGRHQEVNCIKCHQRKGENTLKFTGLNYESCNSCHADIHKSKFGSNCKSCHITASFRTLKTNNSFDHNKTIYPLVGRHLTVGCNNCHKGKNRTRPANEQCIDCHSDYHRREFITESGTKDCNECHSVYGFDRSSYGILEHNQAVFKLTGSHLAVSCNECHFKDNHWTFRVDYGQCTNCHHNVHGSTIKAANNGMDLCEDCHSIDLWSSVLYNHSKDGFILEGSHLKTKCGNCHFVNNSKELEQFHFNKLQSTCESCHYDIHYGQFNLEYGNRCSSCHDSNKWTPSAFDHSNSKYILDGSHINVQCGKCHRKESIGDLTYTYYKLDKFKCLDCH